MSNASGQAKEVTKSAAQQADDAVQKGSKTVASKARTPGVE